MASLTETEIAVLRKVASVGWYPYVDGRLDGVGPSLDRLYDINLIKGDRVGRAWCATPAGRIVLALLDQVAELTAELPAVQPRSHG